MKKRSSKDIFAETMLALARQGPVDRITVKQLVDRSGLSLQTFYNHFHSKEDLILWMHRRGAERALARLEGKRYGFHDLTMDNIRFYAENVNYLRGSFQGGIISPYAEISAQSACSLLASFICRRHQLEALPAELEFFLRMYVFACLYAFWEWSNTDPKVTQEQLADYLEQAMPEKLRPYLLGNG